MKIAQLSFLPLGVISSFFLSTGCHAAPIPYCSDQAKCFEFTEEIVTPFSVCNAGGRCTVKVCMKYTNQAGCPKGGDDISHLCDSGDTSGCLRPTLPNLFDGSGEVSCGADGSTAVDKCKNAQEGIVFCQEARNGETVYFVVKDGNAKNPDTYAKPGMGACAPTIQCDVAKNRGVGNCGNVAKQAEKEMVWSYTISPDICKGKCFCPPNTKLVKVDFSQNKDGTTTYNHGDYISDLAYGFTGDAVHGTRWQPYRRQVCKWRTCGMPR